MNRTSRLRRAPYMLSLAVQHVVLTPFLLHCAQVAVVAGGFAVSRQVRVLIKAAQREQRALCAEAEAAGGRSSGGRGGGARAGGNRIAVDRRFFNRLMRILSM